ncbi:MAG: GGDEF domain-containing protein [Candidatus Pacearchaeota archaeon]
MAKEEEKRKRYAALKDIAKKFESEIERQNPRKSQLSKIFENLYFLATRDQLTGVFNRRALDEFLGHEMLRAIRHQTPISVIMIDIDDFKKYNDIYGHQQGDEALRTVTSIIQKHTRKIDFAARYGGEEFILVLPDTKVADAINIAERIRKDVENVSVKPVKKDLPAGYNHITVSMGIAGADKWEKDGFEITHRADIALYEAKRSGKNRIHVAK